jgi:hypothetical protein
MMRTSLSFSLLLAALLAGCQVSMWAGPLDDPYELNLPGRTEATPTPVPTPFNMPK